MQIDILSDLHFDYYFVYKNSVDENQIIDFFNSYFNKMVKKIIRMIDRGQISQETAEDLLKDEYSEYASLVECVWDNPDEIF